MEKVLLDLKLFNYKTNFYSKRKSQYTIIQGLNTS